MAAQHPPRRQQSTLERPVDLNGLKGVGGAGGNKAAAGRPGGGDVLAVIPHQKQQNLFHSLTSPPDSACGTAAQRTPPAVGNTRNRPAPGPPPPGPPPAPAGARGGGRSPAGGGAADCAPQHVPPWWTR